MLSKRLEELSRDPNDPNSIAELVVTALGTGGSYYICWKTRSGQYKQDSHGLPVELQEWLCPTNGSVRDFDSLQVILGPGDGDFVASDCHGRVKNKIPEQRPKPLERARTFRSYDANTKSRPLSMVVSPSDSLGDGRQRRSATVGSLDYSGTNRRTSLIYEEPNSAPKEERENMPRLASFVSIAARVNRFRRRPMSMYHTGAQPLVNTDITPDRSTSSLGSRVGLGPAPSDPSTEPSPSRSVVHELVHKYVDAGVQTELSRSPLPIQTNFHDYQRHRHTRDSSSVSSASSIFTSYSEASTRRSSVAEDHSAKPTYRQPCNHFSNPVLMGRMQDYFRASGYRLGDALQS